MHDVIGQAEGRSRQIRFWTLLTFTFSVEEQDHLAERDQPLQMLERNLKLS